MNFKDRIRLSLMENEYHKQKLNEEVYAGYTTAYHRTSNIDVFKQGVDTKGFETEFQRTGLRFGYFGDGISATIYLDSQINNFMSQSYGDYIIKLTIKNGNFISFDPEITQRLHGSNLNFLQQIDKLRIKISNKQRKMMQEIVSKGVIGWEEQGGDIFYDNVSSDERDDIDNNSRLQCFLFYNIFLHTRSKKVAIDGIDGLIWNDTEEFGETIVIYNYDLVSFDGYYDNDNKYHKFQLKNQNKKSLVSTAVKNLVSTKQKNYTDIDWFNEHNIRYYDKMSDGSYDLDKTDIEIIDFIDNNHKITLKNVGRFSLDNVKLDKAYFIPETCYHILLQACDMVNLIPFQKTKFLGGKRFTINRLNLESLKGLPPTTETLTFYKVNGLINLDSLDDIVTEIEIDDCPDIVDVSKLFSFKKLKALEIVSEHNIPKKQITALKKQGVKVTLS